MIRTLISIALNRDLQGDPVYIRCARCGAIGDTPTRTLHVTTYRPGLRGAARVAAPRRLRWLVVAPDRPFCRGWLELQ
jgi:hypothetical protein